MLRKALRAPVAVGEKITLMVQLAPAATLLPHPLVGVKSLMFVPWIVTLVIDIAVLPALRKVTFLAALVVPTVWAAKVKLAGFTETAVPVPNSRTACCP